MTFDEFIAEIGDCGGIDEAIAQRRRTGRITEPNLTPVQMAFIRAFDNACDFFSDYCEAADEVYEAWDEAGLK